MNEPIDHAEPRGLHRAIGIPGVAFTAFNGIVGMGIFGLPGLVAGVLGPAAILAYIACLVLVALVGLCFAEAGSRVKANGGIYAFAHEAFGPVTAGVAGMLIVCANAVAACAALLRFALDTLAASVPAFASPAASLGLLAAVYAFLVLVNVRGVHAGSRLMVTISLVKLAPLVILIICGVGMIHADNLHFAHVPGPAKIGEGALLLFFAFIGVENGSYLSGETRDPARVVPRAIFLALVLVAGLYIGLQTVAQGLLGPALANAPAPLLDSARVIFGAAGARFVLIATMLSALGFMVTDLLSSPRVVHALAEAGQLPAPLGWVHPRYRTPSVAIALYPVAVLAVVASGTFRQIAILGTAGTLVLYLIVCGGVLRLRAKGVAQAGKPFIAPGGAILPMVAIAMILWLLSTLSMQEMLVTAAFIAITAIAFALLAARQRPAAIA